MKIFIIITVLLICTCSLIFGVGSIIGDRVIDEGDLPITVTQLHHPGVFFKTWEVAASSGGWTDFTVNDPTILEQIRACTSPCSLRVHYMQKLWAPLQSESGGRFITSVERESQ